MKSKYLSKIDIILIIDKKTIQKAKRKLENLGLDVRVVDQPTNLKDM